MKNFIEIPRKEDYHNTTIFDVNQVGREPQREKNMLLYHKGRINLRSIVDLHEWTINLDVIDEEKYPEWEKQRKEWAEKSEFQPEFPTASPFPIGLPPPPVPIKTKTIKLTGVLYFSGVQRFIMDDFGDFCELYDNYLTSQKLDFDIKKQE
jgi:hypothetical protein